LGNVVQLCRAGAIVFALAALLNCAIPVALLVVR
jgi:hypothetical protein